jgi:hypothetical protein
MKFLKITKFNCWGYKEKNYLFLGHLVDFLYALGVRLSTCIVGHICRMSQP